MVFSLSVVCYFLPWPLWFSSLYICTTVACNFYLFFQNLHASSLWRRLLKNHKIQSPCPCHFCIRTVWELGVLCLSTGGSHGVFPHWSWFFFFLNLIPCSTSYFTLPTFSSPKTLRFYSLLLLYQFSSLVFCFTAFHYSQHQILLWVISEILHLQYFFLHMAEQPVEQPVLLSQLIPCFPWLLQVTTVMFQFG